jgi:hypothetical protein
MKRAAKSISLAALEKGGVEFDCKRGVKLRKPD